MFILALQFPQLANFSWIKVLSKKPHPLASQRLFGWAKFWFHVKTENFIEIMKCVFTVLKTQSKLGIIQLPKEIKFCWIVGVFGSLFFPYILLWKFLNIQKSWKNCTVNYLHTYHLDSIINVLLYLFNHISFETFLIVCLVIPIIIGWELSDLFSNEFQLDYVAARRKVREKRVRRSRYYWPACKTDRNPITRVATIYWVVTMF